jgi:hypothetical protein
MVMLLVGCALGVLAFVVPARASVKAVCEVSAVAKVEDKADPQFGLRLIGGSGKFTFSSLAIECNGSENGIPAVVFVTVDARGYYDNIVCGTGKAFGTSLKVLQVSKVGGDPMKGAAYYDALLSDEKFAVEVTAFSGGFYWHDWDKAALNTKLDLTAEDPDKPRTDKDWELAGDITLTGPLPPPAPSGKSFTPPNTPPGHCAKSLTLSGVIGIDEA